ncbi:hypothetical protein [Streptomyces sp. NPDC002851]
MSAHDQEAADGDREKAAATEAAPEAESAPTTKAGPESEPEDRPQDEADVEAEDGPEDGHADRPEDGLEDKPEVKPEDGLDDGPDDEAGPVGLTPRQARRLRIAAAAVLMAVAAAVLAIRLASRSSVLVVGVYGLLLILCGIVIELSRRGRTRLGTWLLGAGLVAALVADWVVLP